MTWLTILRLLLRLLAGGAVGFAVSHEVTAAQVHNQGVNFWPIVQWAIAAAGVWFSTTGGVWERLRKLLPWVRDNPPPLDDLFRARDQVASIVARRSDLPLETRKAALAALDSLCCCATLHSPEPKPV